jgi:oxalate decarboxylase/phosphoglucose isomerase-like protein (cupin superfamily)
MRSEFKPGEEATIISLADLRDKSQVWGKRIFAPRLPEMYNSTWEIVWYQPGAYSAPHDHPRTESVYYFDFKGGAGKCNIYLGWPLSQAKVTIITSAALVYIPAHVVHCYSNVGETEMVLVHSFSPPWERDRGVSTDTTDTLTGHKYSDMNEYGDFVTELCSKYGTFDEYVEHVKSIGQY